MPDTAIAALLAHRAGLAARLAELECQAIPIRADIFHLDAAMAIMGNGTAPRMRAQHRPEWFANLGRLILDVLRGGAGAHVRSEMGMTTDDPWAAKARGLLKAELKRRDVGQLVERLAAIGVTETQASIANKISRGAFTAAFLLQCMEAIGYHTLRLEAD